MPGNPQTAAEQIKTLVSIQPLAEKAAGTTNGAAIDRMPTASDQGYRSLRLTNIVGAVSGTPTSFTVDSKIQDSADGSTGWADYTPPNGGSGATPTGTVINTVYERAIDLTGAKRYVRVVEVVAFVAGTTPKVFTTQAVVLAGPATLPV